MKPGARAFVAVVPPDEVLDAVARVVDNLARDLRVRFTTRPQWHLTLQFLGNRVDVDAVAAALEALAVRAGPVRLGGAGGFPNERRGRTLWLGVADGNALVSQLAAAVGALVTPLGHAPEDRPYHPHLTLARLKRPGDLRAVVAELGAEPVGPAWRVEDVALVESRTRPEGAEYAERRRFRLG